MAERAYGGLTKVERDAQREQRLLDSALTLFCEQGYANTRIEELCRHAKVTARHFYQQFGTKEALLLALYRQIISRLTSAVASVMTSPPESDMTPQVRRAVDALVQHYLQDQRLARIGVLEVVGASPAIELERRRSIANFAAVVEGYLNNLMALGKLPQRDYKLTALALVGGINELMADWLTREAPYPIETLSEEIMHIVLNFVRGATMSPEIATDEVML